MKVKLNAFPWIAVAAGALSMPGAWTTVSVKDWAQSRTRWRSVNVSL